MSHALPRIDLALEQLGEPIAYGRTSKIYALDGGRILKVLNEGWDARETEIEARGALAAGATALDTPKLHAIATVGGRPGLVFDRVEGLWLFKGLDRTPESMERLAVELATVHATIHRESGAEKGLITVHRRLEEAMRRAPISDAVRQEGLRRLETLPYGSALLHMDLHPYQILRIGERRVILDWVTASQGVPAADVARTAFLLSAGKIDDPDLLWLNQGLYRSALAHRYVNEYCRQTGLTVAEIEEWFYPLAAARRAEVDDDNPAMLDFLEAGVNAPAAQPFMVAKQ